MDWEKVAQIMQVVHDWGIVAFMFMVLVGGTIVIIRHRDEFFDIELKLPGEKGKKKAAKKAAKEEKKRRKEAQRWWYQ